MTDNTKYEVTQADRDAAASVETTPTGRDMALEGRGRLVQAFARHRLTSQPAQSEVEPVAWRWRNPGGVWNYQEGRQRIAGVEHQALYATPTTDTQSDPVREDYQRGMERAAAMIQKRMDDRFAEHGIVEPDTNHGYYPGSAGETYEALDEEADEIIKAIRNEAADTGGAK